jgi:D-serine deaminase-like pyridoxal phosphate-dependent protein
LTILATVISKTPGERLIVDAGFRAMSGENGLPGIKGTEGLRTKALHIEHTILEIIDPALSIEVGDKLEIWIRFLDQTLGLHDHLYGIRAGKVEHIFKIEH